MDEYTVEVITAPVENDDWGLIHTAMDDIPGTVLLADPDEPTLLFPVRADSPLKAVQLVDGLATLIGLKIDRGKVYPAEDWSAPFEASGQETPESNLVNGLREWVDQTPPPPSRLRDELVCA